MSHTESSLERLTSEVQGSQAYVPPAIKQVLQPDDLEREVAYAGQVLVGSYLP